MEDSLEILIDPLIRKRLESLHSELTKHNSYFKEISNESKQYLQTLQASLPDNLQHTLFLYEDAQFSIRTVLDSKIYLQGFKDALYLFGELHISKT
ncbi:hypothetical protein [Paenibacillus fonticola]|uniref:hypothetical protein n=1 Tax=Paenibacillus fonticola TaxID=379896 RepID=UPI00037113C5|nr:hypothetical protein [Paenibacillus fonticola]